MKKAIPEDAIANTSDVNSYDVGQGSTRRIYTLVWPERSALKKRSSRDSPLLVDFVSFLL